MGEPMTKRDRDQRHDEKRRAEKPWRAWYASPEWKRARAQQLKREPWCRMCAAQGHQRKAIIADHIERHGGDRTKFFRGALQSLCRHHHDSVKQALERGNRAGCDASGMPTDPKHPWSM